MKISHLKIQSFLGVKHFDVEFGEFVLIAGFNGSGKSSVENAIRLAYTGALPRISLRKELGALVHQGAKAAAIEATGDPGASLTITSAGKATGIANELDTPWWAYALTDMHYLSSIDPTALRKCLFSHAGAGSPEEVTNKMLQGGADLQLLNQIKPLLRNFEAAEKQAETNAKEARGEWKGITGETYGEVKADTWEATMPKVGKEVVDCADALRTSADAAQQMLADARATAAGCELAASRLTQARDVAKDVPRLKEAVKTYQDEIAALEKEIPALEAKAAGKTGPTALASGACPECGSVLHILPDHTLMAQADYEEAGKGKPDPAAKKTLDAQRQKLLLARSALHVAETNLKSAEIAAARIPELEEAASEPDLKIDVLEAAASQASATWNAHIRELGDYRAAVVGQRVAKDKTAGAAKAHAAVKGWSTIKELCSPNGVPAQFLDAVLATFNARLAVSAQRTKWGQVQIAPDMAITYGQRQLQLCSESEKWRADAMLVEAVAHMTAEGFVMLDRFDVLGTEQRVALLDWCDSIVADGAQVVLLGTLKEKTSMEGVTNVWLANGETK